MHVLLADAQELFVANTYSRVPGHSRASSAVANRRVFVYLLTATSRPQRREDEQHWPD